MAPPKEGPPPHHKYGSVDTSEEPASQCSLLPTSRWNINTSFLATAGGQRRPPQQKNEDNLRDPQEERHISPRLAVAIVCGLAFLAGSGVSWSQSSGGRSRAAAASSGLFEVSTRAGIPAAETRPGEASSDVAEYADVVALEFTALNFYHVRDGKPGQDYPWLKDIKLIEPHRDTTLAVVGAREGFDYRWEVRAGSSSSGPGELGGMQSTATGAVTIVVLTQLDENVVVLEEVDEDGKVTNRLEETVMVKYVRREIRTLTDDEREEVLDAMFQLWAVRVDGGEGKEIYGEDYADVYAMNRLHHKASASRACNYFHDGMGFLVSHALLTNTFEFSLQRVNPKLTLPYWDFTIETTAAAGIEYDPDRPFTRTELLSPSWFGTVDLNDKMVKDGRWAYTEIPIAKDDITSDVYGKLRAPWGVNDRAYISRGPGEVCQTSISGPQAWPSCGSHYDLTTGNPAFYSWVWTSMASPHAPVHLWIGGNLDCGTMYNKIGALVGSDIAKTLAFMSNGHRKGLFLSNAWGCNRSALVDEKPHEIMSSDTCGCHGYDLTQGDDYKAVMALLAYVEFYIGGYSEDIQRQVVELLCNGVLSYGEQAQSSSPLDPMFWPMHGTMERLWQFAVLTGQVTDFTWPDEDMNVTLPDGTIDTQYVSSYEVCIGHRGSDVFPYGLLSSDVDTFEVKTGIRSNPVTGNELTNREVLASLDPRSNPLTYVYDTFKWEHCGPEGYDFDDAWRETVPSPRKQFYQRDEPRSTLYTSFKREMAELMKENHGSSFEEA